MICITKSKGYEVSVGRVGKLECDFILHKNHFDYAYIQVAMTVMNSIETENRECRPLNHVFTASAAHRRRPVGSASVCVEQLPIIKFSVIFLFQRFDHIVCKFIIWCRDSQFFSHPHDCACEHIYFSVPSGVFNFWQMCAT